jgi:hypothetical protein
MLFYLKGLGLCRSLLCICYPFCIKVRNESIIESETYLSVFQSLCSSPKKLKAKAVPLHAAKTLGGEEVNSYSFSNSAVDGGE